MMLPLALIALAQGAALGPAPRQDPASPQASPRIDGAGLGVPTATVAPVDGAGPVQVGDLVRFAVTVESALGVELAEPPAFDVALEVVEASVSERATPSGARVDAFEWTLRVLAGGELRTPAVSLAGAEGTAPLVAEPTTFEVAPALPEDVDEAQPLPGFREPAARRIGDPSVAVGIALAIVLAPLLVLGFVRLRRRASDGAAATAPPTPRERLADLRPEDDPRAVVAALAPLVRALVDEARGTSAPAATDAEWVALVGADEALAPVTREAAAKLVLESSDMRYGGGSPTLFAAKDAKSRAESLAETLAAGGGR